MTPVLLVVLFLFFQSAVACYVFCSFMVVAVLLGVNIDNV